MHFLAVGCSLSKMPDAKYIEQRNIEGIEVISTKCDYASISNLCLPLTSYVNYKCKDGYTLLYDYTQVKCLLSMLWDDIPECVPIKKFNDAQNNQNVQDNQVGGNPDYGAFLDAAAETTRTASATLDQNPTTVLVIVNETVTNADILASIPAK